MRVLVFGDSITQGFWDSEGGWVARLRKYYDKKKIEDLRSEKEIPDVFNLGISGGSSKTILDRFENETRARKNSEDMAIIICTGVNDSCLLENEKSMTPPDEYERNLRKLALQAKAFTDKVIFVGLVAADESQTMPVFWRNIYYPNKRIKDYESMMAGVAQKGAITFIPVFDEFKKHLDGGENILADGLHPNNEGHELIFQLVRPALDDILNT